MVRERVAPHHWLPRLWHTRYGVLGEADLPNLPRELNPYERFRVRLFWAGAKAVVAVVLGAASGLLWAWLVGVRY